MSGKLIVDTNRVIGLLAGDPQAVSVFDQADEVLLTVIVLGELHYGARRSARIDDNVARIRALAATMGALDVDARTSSHYGVIKAQLAADGRPIPSNDIWIAALAQQHDLPVATRDQHFTHIKSIDLITW